MKTGLFAAGQERPKPKLIEFSFGTGVTFQSKFDPKTKFTDAVFSFSTLPAGMPRSQTTLPRVSKLPVLPFTPRTELPPRAPRTPVSVEIDETAETILLSCKATLDRLTENGDSARSHIGTGELHFNKGEGFHRILLRRDPLKAVALDVKVTPDMKPTILENERNVIQFVGRSDPRSGKLALLRLSLENGDIARQLHTFWTNANAPNAESTSD
jgi:hypothetical protein